MTNTRRYLITISFSILVPLSTFAQERGGIRKVDFRNFTFESAEKKFVLRDGSYKEGDAASWDSYSINSVRYSDFDRDGREDAFVVIDFESSGTLDNAKDYFVFAYTRGRPRMIFHEWREKPQSFQVQGRQIIIAAPFWKDGGLCCPAGLETSIYRWRTGRFVRASRHLEYRDPYTNWWLPRRTEQALGADSP
jgi:hypothetical protein